MLSIGGLHIVRQSSTQMMGPTHINICYVLLLLLTVLMYAMLSTTQKLAHRPYHVGIDEACGVSNLLHGLGNSCIGGKTPQT